MSSTHTQEFNSILEHSDFTISHVFTCPSVLFAAIIRINHLREQTLHSATTSSASTLEQELWEILDGVEGFSSIEWAASQSQVSPARCDEWAHLASAHQAAIALYAIISLTGGGGDPLAARRALHRQLLRTSLDAALRSLRTKRFMLWPLLVLGVDAGASANHYREEKDGYEDGSSWTTAEWRRFIAEELAGLADHAGTYAPLAARRVLEAFWASSLSAEGGYGTARSSWDACFDSPYVFTMQIAVDTSGILMNG